MKYSVIGSGFSGLSTAAYLAKEGHEVHVFEKNESLGGRARQFKAEGYTFDMGPSWYWMPDVFEKFFKDFNAKPSDFYELIELNPGFQIIFPDSHTIKLSSKWEEVHALFEKHESGASKKLDAFIKEAEFKYDIGMNEVVHQPGLSILELFKPVIIKNVFKLQMLSSYRKHVAKYFKNPFLVALLEFPVLFLGTAPAKTPALYSLMTYSGIKQGTFYPMGGFSKVIDGMAEVCRKYGVKFHMNSEVEHIEVKKKKVVSIKTNQGSFDVETLICSADYHHIDKEILAPEFSNYSEKYWDSRVLSPSCLLFYMGVDKKLEKLKHHNLFFDENIDNHVEDIYDTKIWPKKPLFYACCPSKTDASMAPKNKENLFILVPITPGLEDNESIRKTYFGIIMDRLEKYCGHEIRAHVEYKRSYCINDFVNDYNSYKGNAYGLANTLNQTANLKPKIINKHIQNLFYTGQLTVPGPGVPPSIISGSVVANYVMNQMSK
tara:strand:- start:2872 stop:4341 length:1470 start_codon:yes stop_codon:yes gene_type:complete